MRWCLTRNLAAFWDGTHLRRTPAYGLAPGPRSGETATQAMACTRHAQGLPGQRSSDRQRMWGRQFLDPGAFHG